MMSFKPVRKMPDGTFGVFRRQIQNVKTKGKTKRQRIMTPGQHAKELKKTYKNEKDANDYMAAIMIQSMKSFKNLFQKWQHKIDVSDLIHFAEGSKISFRWNR